MGLLFLVAYIGISDIMWLKTVNSFWYCECGWNKNHHTQGAEFEKPLL